MKVKMRDYVLVQLITLFVIALFSFFQECIGLLSTYVFFAVICLLFDFFKKQSVVSLYFNLQVIASLVLIFLFQIDSGSNWAGLDDKLFYLVGSGQTIDKIHLFNISWFGYYFVLDHFFNIIGSFIDADLHYYHGIILNVFFSSFTLYFLNKHFVKRYSQRSVFIFNLLFLLPQFLIFNATYLRDSFITLFFATLVYVVSLDKLNIILKSLVVFIVLLASFTFRAASSIFLLIYVLLFVFKSVDIKFSVIGFILISTLVFVNFQKMDLNAVEESRRSYEKLTASEASSNSIGQKILNNKSPLILPVKYVYLIYSPIPPDLFFRVNLKSVIFSVGSIIKYYLTTMFFIGVFMSFIVKERDSNLMLEFFYILIIATAILSTSGDPRHLSFIHPIIFMRGLEATEVYKSSGRKVWFYGLVLSPLVVIFYIIIKLF